MRAFLMSSMKSLKTGSLALLPVLLVGCGSTPNNPSVDLNTQKTPADYVACIYPKWQKIKPEASLTESKGHYKILVSSKVAADNILEVYKGNPNTRVFLYQRAPLSSLVHSNLELAARDCL
jgi:hypothetical protein